MNRRKLRFVTVLILVVAAFGIAGWLWSSEASINYGLDLDYKYQRQDNDWFTVDWTNNIQMNGTFISIDMGNAGYFAGTFSITVTFMNATFSTKTQQPYQQINNNVVRLTYTLRHYEEAQPNVYFDIDENAKGFTISLSIEYATAFMRSTEINPHGMSTLQYHWESVENAYMASVPS